MPYRWKTAFDVTSDAANLLCPRRSGRLSGYAAKTGYLDILFYITRPADLTFLIIDLKWVPPVSASRDHGPASKLADGNASAMPSETGRQPGFSQPDPTIPWQRMQRFLTLGFRHVLAADDTDHIPLFILRPIVPFRPLPLWLVTSDAGVCRGIHRLTLAAGALRGTALTLALVRAAHRPAAGGLHSSYVAIDNIADPLGAATLAGWHDLRHRSPSTVMPAFARRPPVRQFAGRARPRIGARVQPARPSVRSWCWLAVPVMSFPSPARIVPERLCRHHLSGCRRGQSGWVTSMTDRLSATFWQQRP